MGEMRKRHSPGLKMKVAMDATVGEKTIAEIASKHRVHPTQVSQWKKQFQESAPEIFGGKKQQSGPSEALVSQLYEEVGRLKFELDWVKKKASRFGGL
jgi:transposase-like protein